MSVILASSPLEAHREPALSTSVLWHVAPLGRLLCAVAMDDEDDVMTHVLGGLLRGAEGAYDMKREIAFELFVLVRSTQGSLLMCPCPTGWSMHRICAAITSVDCAATILKGIAVPRCRGGKGGFGKNLAKKGRLYIKAQRRGETNTNLNQLARNLRGERIGGQEANHEGQQPTTVAHQRQLPQEVEAAYAEVRREHEHKTHERDVFATVIREAVTEGFRATVDAYLKVTHRQNGATAVPGSDS
ncbi:Hypothetical protein, putative [Bodo saltans]|uniref:SDE2-like domain-containing protein n=1 Tax=Bodo saltans TaxID=75058 RepID=A0A0S4KHR5_BODSA|nr:Hypothetical protein, putative [Bodo saltans]|eukprot:CUI12367.1 Hypothetical protein, putative [Bodo saltans]